MPETAPYDLDEPVPYLLTEPDAADSRLLNAVGCFVGAWLILAFVALVTTGVFVVIAALLKVAK